MKKRQILKEKKKIHNDCWNLDHAFLKWLKPRLKDYLKCAGKTVDLDFYVFEFRDKKMTQKEIIERMIEILELYDDYNIYYFGNDCKESTAYTNELLELWKTVFPVMWW